MDSDGLIYLIDQTSQGVGGVATIMHFNLWTGTRVEFSTVISSSLTPAEHWTFQLKDGL